MASKLKWFNIGLRGLMEAGIIIALGYWGYQTGQGKLMKILLAVGAPLLGFGFWGAVDFHRAGRMAVVAHTRAMAAISSRAPTPTPCHS